MKSGAAGWLLTDAVFRWDARQRHDLLDLGNTDNIFAEYDNG